MNGLVVRQAECIVEANACVIVFGDATRSVIGSKGLRVEQLVERAKAEEIMLHTPLLHGTYRVLVRIGGALPDQPFRRGSIDLPSGEVVAWSALDDAHSISVIHVDPGRYAFALD